MLAFRIFVMLSCLIIVPMAAIFGSAFPDVVKSVLVDRIVYWATGQVPEPAPSGGQGEFGTVGPADAGPPPADPSDAPPWHGPHGATSPQGYSADPQAAGVVPAGATLVNPDARGQQAAHAAPLAPGFDRGPAFDSVYAQEVSEAHPRTIGQTADPSGDVVSSPPAAQSMTQPDPFTAMERKLREHGATYYLLETWGTDGELFRFHCKMAVGNNPNTTRHFEATDRDALRAMSQVLARVEAWRAGRPQ